MRNTPRRDTPKELALRRLLHARGLRYRVDHRVIPGLNRRPDVVFTRRKVAVFIDGCFWHRCPTHGSAPKANAAWWRDKLDRNVARDRDTDALFAEHGWTVLRFWEHEDPEVAAIIVEAAVATPKRNSP